MINRERQMAVWVLTLMKNMDKQMDFQQSRFLVQYFPRLQFSLSFSVSPVNANIVSSNRLQYCPATFFFFKQGVVTVQL